VTAAEAARIARELGDAGYGARIESEVIVETTAEQREGRKFRDYRVVLESGPPLLLNSGHVAHISKHGVVVEEHAGDPV
jgi:hypothetical protein